MDIFLVCFFVLNANIKSFFIRFFYINSLDIDNFIFSPSFPSVRIRCNGKVIFHRVKFRGGCSLFSDGGQIVLGRGSFLNKNCSINCRESIEIGEKTLLGENVKIYDHNHRIIEGVVSYTEFDCAAVKIGRGCWIGSNVVILPGVSICDHVIIGSGSVITKSIEESGVYVTKNIGLRKLK